MKTSELLFYIIVGILIFDFLFEAILSYLNNKTRTTVLPEELQGIYDDATYKKQQDYDATKYRFGIITSVFNLCLMMGMIFFHGFAYVDKLVANYTANPIYSALLFFGILAVAMDILSMPFSLYSTFVIEERFGFNKTTAKTYIMDKIKGLFIAVILGGGLLSLFVWFYEIAGSYFWLYAWGAISLFMILMSMFYSSVILPLFNKLMPLEEGELRTDIEAYCNKVGFKLKNLFIMDGSKRSNKANAFFTGLGSRKTIVLFDTLVNNHTNDELVAVLAHEVGHYKKKHTLTSIFISIAQMGVFLFLLSWLIGNADLFAALGADHTSFQIGLVAFGLLISPVSFILSIFFNLLSRKNEYEADAYAAETFKGAALADALKKLSKNNLSNLTPHPLYVFFHYSHPTLLQRLVALNKKKDQFG